MINEQDEKSQITVLQFSFFAGETEKHTAVFYRLGSKQEIQDRLNQYVEGLTSCYDDGAFCDTEQDITIYSYTVSDGFLLHKITLVYDTIDLKDIENSTGADIQTLTINGDDIDLKQGDSYVADEWSQTPEYRLNQNTYEKAAVTGRKITTGDNLEKVILAYNIKTGYALWNLEAYSKSDEKLTLEPMKYVAGEYDKIGVKWATLIIAYYRLEGQWIPLTYDEINQYIAFTIGDDAEKPYEGIIFYQFQFPCNEHQDPVTNRKLVGFSVDYAPAP